MNAVSASLFPFFVSFLQPDKAESALLSMDNMPVANRGRACVFRDVTLTVHLGFVSLFD